MEALAAIWLRALAGMVDPALRAGYLRGELARWPAAELAPALAAVAGAAEGGETAARDLLRALSPVLAEADREAQAAELRALAVMQELAPLLRLLGSPSPATGERRVPAAARPSSERPLTLGERKSLARRPTRRALDRLMRDPDPSVTRVLLGNPNLTEDDVVRMAARRPGRAETLAEIARHQRWVLRPRVRMALIANPATPPSMSAPLLPLLLRAELASVAAASDLPPAIRAAIEARLAAQ